MEKFGEILETLIKISPETAQFFTTIGAYGLVALALYVILKVSNNNNK